MLNPSFDLLLSNTVYNFLIGRVNLYFVMKRTLYIVQNTVKVQLYRIDFYLSYINFIKRKGFCELDKDTFISMSPTKRVQEVNKMLQKYDLKEISKLLGIPSSTFSKLMREGDYLYHQADKKYYPFVRSEAERTASTTTEHSDEITFIKNHLDTLKKVVHHFEEAGNLLLDKRIYSKDAEFVNKSIRMNSAIYENFSHFCEEYYPHLKTQDVIAQALIDAMNRYKPEGRQEP